MGRERFLVTYVTMAILAQRLLRKICSECNTELQPDQESIRELGAFAERYQGQSVYHGTGCDRCEQRGYFGRTGIFELLVMTPAVQELTLRGADSNQIKREAWKSGMRSLRDDGTQKVFDGLSTIEEVLRVTRDEFLDELPD